MLNWLIVVQLAYVIRAPLNTVAIYWSGENIYIMLFPGSIKYDLFGNISVLDFTFCEARPQCLITPFVMVQFFCNYRYGISFGN